MIKRMIIMLLIVGGLLGAVLGGEAFMTMQKKKFFASMGVPPQSVSTATVESKEWQPKVEAVGTLRAEKGADLSAEVAGIVDEVHFNSGQDVESGAVLLKLRLDDDMAALRALEATAKLAEITLDRDTKQLKVQAVSRATVDNDTGALAIAKAEVAKQRANVDKKIIRAPFDGQVGIRNVDIGQYITAGTAITTLQQLDTLYLDFYLPQQTLSKLKVGQKVVIKSELFPDKEFSAKVAAISPKVDISTRNVQIRAELDNADHRLLPGMYATADILAGAPQKYITIPHSAVTYNPYGNTVYVVRDKGKDDKGNALLTAEQLFVTLGDTRGDQVAVLKGVQEGDVLVTSGQMKLRNGSPVVVNNTVSPHNDENPKPVDQ